MSAVLSLLGGVRGLAKIGLILAAVAAVGWLWWSRGEALEDAARYRSQAAQAREAAQANADALDALRDAHRRALEQVEAATEARRERERELQSSLEEVRHAPDEDDGPIAPVLGRALERLRERSGSADADGDGAGGAAGGAADVQP